MADNIVLNQGTGGATLATDEAGTPVKHYQYVKLVDGTADSELKIPGDATNGLDVDVTRLPPIPAGNNNIGDVDVISLPPIPTGNNNIGDVDVLSLPPVPAGTNLIGKVQLRNPGNTADLGDAISPVRVDPVGTTTQPVSDGGGSLTVDGAVSISGQVDTELPAAAALADNSANPSAPAIAAHLMGFDGTDWERLRADPTTRRLEVEVENSPVLGAGNNNIGDVDVLSLPPIPAGNNNIGDVDIVSLPDEGQQAMVNSISVAIASDQSAVKVQGDAAHDAVISGNPIQVGARANLNEPTAVADGDITHLWADLLGRLVVISGHPNPESPVTVNGSAAGTTIISAPGAGVSLFICKGSVHNRAATETVVSLREGLAGTIRWTANLAVDGGGSLFDFGSRGWKLPANTALVADIGQASVDINVTEYYIAP